MKTYTATEASNELADRLKYLKNDHMFACAFSILWLGNNAPPWQRTIKNQLPIIQQFLSEALGADADKATLMLFHGGSLMLLANHLSAAAWKNVVKEFIQILSEMNMAPEDYIVDAQDLSVGWETFVSTARQIYKQNAERKVAEADTTTLLENLSALVARSAPLFAEPRPRVKEEKLLFVEDEPSTRYLLNTLVAAEPLKLHFAINAEEAIRQYCFIQPHIVFLDINLPDFSGLEVLKLINKYDPHAYPIMLTSNANHDDVATAKQYGVKGYIIKPFTRAKLLDCLTRYRQRPSK